MTFEGEPSETPSFARSRLPSIARYRVERRAARA
jgi:hypothetical protein